MQQFNLSYKPHIDGLRAIAVIIVILFHLNPTVFAGGYLGVDMFFVISGFVITQSLYKEYQKQAEFCVFSFYVRRFKRIYPALVTVVVFTLIFYFIFGLLTQTQLILKSGITSIFAISNLFFLYQGADYFDDNIFNPLSHTWSLGIEEQFYFSYPFLLAIGLGAVDRFKLKFGVLPIAIIFFSITSYLIFCLEGDTIFGSFFFPTARFWELGVGCFLFLSSLNFLAFQKFTNIASIIAIGLFFYLQIYPQTIHNLYIETLLAVLAVSLIIHSQIGEENGEIVGLLKHRTVVYLGKISYSLYLWHLPVIYFSKVYLDTVLFYAITPLIIIGLAVLSYHIIEKPFRYSSIFDRAVKVSVFVLPASFMVIILSVKIFGIGQVKSLVNTNIKELDLAMGSINYIESKFNLANRTKHNWSIAGKNVYDLCRADSSNTSLNNLGLRDNCLKKVDNNALFFLTGDSYAQHYASMLDNSSMIKNLYFTQFSSCHLVDGDCPKPFQFQRNPNLISASPDLKSKQINNLVEDFKDIYYVMSWRIYPIHQKQPKLVEENLTNYIQSIDKSINIILIAPTPEFGIAPPKCLIIDYKYCLLDREKDLQRRNKVLVFYQNLQKRFNNVYLYDPYNYLCPEKKCSLYYKTNDLLITMDGSHLSVEGSKYLTPYFENWLHQNFRL